jgi:predicted MFS family arabinose efflux permease
MLVFVIASVAYMAAHSVVTILIVRLFHGLGMGLFPTAATVVVAQVTPPTRRGEAMGWFGIANGLGFMLGPGLGSPLAAWLGFPALFTASGLAAAAGLGCLFAIPNTSQSLRPAERLPRIADLFSRPALLPSILVLALCIPYGTLISFLPLISLGRGLTNAGAAYTVFAGAVLAIRAKAGSVSDRRGRGAVIIPGLLIEALAFLLLGLTADWVSVLGGAALYGVAFGSVQPALLALTVDRVRTEDRGRAMATFFTAWEFGIAVGSSGAGLILQAIDFSRMLLLVGVIPVAGMLLALKLRGPSAAVAN